MTAKTRQRLSLLIVVFLVIVLALTACERQLRQENETPAADVAGEGDVPDFPETGDGSPIGVDTTTVAPVSGEATPETVTPDVDEPVTGIPPDDPTPVGGEETTTDSGESPRPADEATTEAPEGVVEETPEEVAGEPTADEVREVVGGAEVTEQPETAAPPAGPAAQERTHIVAAGENLYRIGLQYGVSWVVLANYNNLGNAHSLTTGQEIKIPADPNVGGGTPTPAPPPTTETTYVVQVGDTLYRIGRAFNVSWEQIAAASGLVNPNRIYVGQVLTIPAGAPGPNPQFTHTVQRGETLFLISLRYGIPWTQVAEANRIAAPYVIYPGQTLTIPGQ